jgi:hypothetical protein
MAETVQSFPSAKRALSRWELLRTSRGWQQGIRHTISYVILIAGAIYVLALVLMSKLRVPLTA